MADNQQRHFKSLPTVCRGKVKYRTFELARQRIEKIKAREKLRAQQLHEERVANKLPAPSKVKKEGRLIPYICDHCQEIHIGHYRTPPLIKLPKDPRKEE